MKINRTQKLSAMVAVCIFFFTHFAHAANGIQLIGIGAIHRGLGGAGVAKPMDSSAILLNPAGMNDLGKRFDLNFTTAFPNTSMDATAVLGNASSSADEAALLPSTGIIYPFLDGKLALGIGAISASGFGVDFNSSRLPTALTGGAYDRSDRYGLLKIIPAASYKVLDNLTIGAAVHINSAFFQSDSATAADGNPETAGAGRYDPAMGIGGSLGLLYKPMDWLSLGLTYTTRQYFEKFNRYTDLIAQSFDMPQQVAAGFGVTPFKGALILTDFRWINWSGVGQLGNLPANGGSGWRDQYIVHAGLQYNFKETFDFPFTLRGGYNYGRSIIPKNVAFNNILVPGVIEHHATGGMGYQATESISFDVSYTRGFKNTVTDDGTINAPGGMSIGTEVHLFSTQLNLTF